MRESHQTEAGTPDATGPLAGITILDLTRVLSGPYCTMMLADMGARVIKVEQPGRGDETRAWGPPFPGGESAYYLSVNRNKQSITLDFKHAAGRRLMEQLVARADVLVENFKPGTLERQGLAYDQLAERYPRLVYCSVSGFGQTGPRRALPGYDAVIQAEGGLMSITGPGDGPGFRLGVAIADIVAGMFAAHGIVLALYARERTGLGQLVDVAMLDSVAALLTYQAGIYFATGQAPHRMGNRHPTIVPYETFDTADGAIVIAVGNDEQWRRFCTVLELPDLAEDPRFATNRSRVTAHDELHPLLDRRVRTRTRDEWIERLSAAGIPCGAVKDLGQVLNDPQLVARDMIEQLSHSKVGALKLLGVPIKLSGTPGRVASPPPRLGEHTDAILREDLGLSQADIENLRSNAVI